MEVVNSSFKKTPVVSALFLAFLCFSIWWMSSSGRAKDQMASRIFVNPGRLFNKFNFTNSNDEEQAKKDDMIFEELNEHNERLEKLEETLEDKRRIESLETEVEMLTDLIKGIKLPNASLSTNFINKNKPKESKPKEKSEMNVSKEVKQFLNVSNATDFTLWVGMGICWAETHQIRKGKPFHEAAYWASKLWQFFAGKLNMKIKTSLTVFISEEKMEPEKENLNLYIKRFDNISNTFVKVEKADPKVGCITQSQMGRVFAVLDESLGIKENDIIITSDSDAFPMNDEIFNVITNGLKTKKEVFIFQYYFTESTGSTYPLSFIAMTKRKWAKFFETNPKTMSRGLEEITQTAAAKGIQKFDKWYLDQIFVTRGIIKSRLCRAQPSRQNFWNGIFMQKETYFEETRDKITADPVTGISYNSKKEIDVCFYGNSEFGNCNLGRRSIKGRCTWWHFYPHEKGPDFQRKYEEAVRKNGGNL